MTGGAAGGPAGAVAVVAGVLVMTTVFLLATAAHRPSTRPLGPAVTTDGRRNLGRWARPALIGAVAVAAGFVAGPLAAGVLVAAVLAGRALRRRAASARRKRAVEEAMPDAVELFVLCVHAGCSPTQAVVELARHAPSPARPAFAAVELQLHRGRAMADALAELPRLTGSAGHELASAVAIAERDGLPLGPVLERLAADARATRRRAGEAAARRLPVQLSFPLVVCTLPSFVLLAIAPAVLGALSTLRGRAP